MALTKLNFAQGPGRLAGWRLAALAALLAALAGQGIDLAVKLRQGALLEAQVLAAQPRRAPAPALSAAQSRDQEQQARLVAEAVRQLNLPVGRLMRALQTPRDIHVVLLGVDLNGKGEADGGTLKIGAEAESAHDMMNYVAFLAEQPLLSSVYLVKHEHAEAMPEQGYRFQVEAQWKE